MAAFVPGFSC